jgi:transcriptional regulator with XRE-family HTH domain
MKVLPERLKEARERSGLNQRQVADKLNISQGSVSLQERDKRNIDSDLLDAYASLYNVSADWLLGKTDDSTPPSKEKGGLNDSPPDLYEILNDDPVFKGVPIPRKDLDFFIDYLTRVRNYLKHKD